jgi:hypothetical protein
MGHNEFDEQIRASLEDLASHQVPASDSWDKFVHRLSTIEAPQPTQDNENTHIDSTDAFDENIREKLSPTNLDTTYQYRHWLRLSEILDEQKTRVLWIRRQKIAEASILALLLLAFVNILDIPKHKITALTKPLVQLKHKITGESTTEHNSNNNANPLSTQLATLVYTSPTMEKTVSNAIKTPTHIVHRQSVKKLELLKRSILPVLPTAIIKNVSSEKITAITPLPILNPTSTGSVAIKRTLNIANINKNKKTTHWSIAFVGIADLNQIYTPTLNFSGLSIASSTKYHLGGGGGFIFSKEKEKSAFDFGFIHSTKKYTTDAFNINDIDANGLKYTETLNAVNISQIQIPLAYRFKFRAKSPKTDIYASLGTTLNIITQANYFGSREYYNIYALRAAPDVVEPQSAIEKIKAGNIGLLQGGTIQDNSYLSAQAALGIEYHFNAKFSYFNQATYQRHLTIKGIGSTNNYYHAISLAMGLKRHF